MAIFNSYVKLLEGSITVYLYIVHRWEVPKIGIITPNHPKLDHFKIETHGFGVPSCMETPIYV